MTNRRVLSLPAPACGRQGRQAPLPSCLSIKAGGRTQGFSCPHGILLPCFAEPQNDNLFLPFVILRRQPGKRISPFQAAHLLHSLVIGIEAIHRLREYHGDLHPENIIVGRYGLRFDLKLVDMFHWTTPKRENIQDDICDLVRIFYDATGGATRYARQPDEVKKICCGLKRSLILERFPSASHLRQHLETMQWK